MILCFNLNKPLARFINVYPDHLAGVTYSSVNCYTGTVLVAFDPVKTSLSLIRKNLSKALTSTIPSKDMEEDKYSTYYKTIAQRDTSARKFVLYGLTYIAGVQLIPCKTFL